MVAQKEPYYTPEEYLALERAAEYKSEYLDGEIFAITGSSPDHNTIALNIARHLGNQFEGGSCRVFASDVRVRVSASGLYTYPDVMVICGSLEYADDQRDTLLNPNVVFEVLSPSTEAYDRGKKFEHYEYIASLTDYLLLSQDRMRLDHFTRQGNGWFRSTAGEADDVIRIEAINAELRLAEIYTNVVFTSHP